MKPRSDDANAFFPDPQDGHVRVRDDLAETLGEDFVQSATSGSSAGEDVFDSVVPEEEGGPFVETSGQQEFAHGTDASNPPDAEAEPLPLASASGVAEPTGDEDDEDNENG